MTFDETLCTNQEPVTQPVLKSCVGDTLVKSKMKYSMLKLLPKNVGIREKMEVTCFQ